VIDAFRGLYAADEMLHTDTKLPVIHVYCFQNPDGANEAILETVREALDFQIEADKLSIHNVRNVAPKKVCLVDNNDADSQDMYCCTFRLPPEVAFARV
jgi:tRNA (guanine37-N1)-methyltransferase